MNFKKLFWHRLAIAALILLAWGIIVPTGGLSLLLVFALLGALAGTFFKDQTAAKVKNWRWFTVAGGVFVLAYASIYLILPFTTAAVPKGQEPDFIAQANTALFYGLFALMLLSLGRIGAEAYRKFAARNSGN